MRNRRHLRERRLNIGGWTEKYFDNRPAIQRLRFDVLDVVNQSGEAALRLRNNSVRHVLRRKPLIVPHHTDDRDVDIGKNVCRRAQHHNRSEEQNQQRHHNERVWPAQR